MFFTLDDIAIKPTEPNCKACGLCRTAPTVKAFTVGHVGPGTALVVHSSPVDKAHAMADWLRPVLANKGLDHLPAIGAMACGPVDDGEASIAAAAHCRPWLDRTIKALQPTAIVPIGQTAISAVVGLLWGKEAGVASNWGGRQIPDQTANAWVLPINTVGVTPEVTKLWRDKHLDTAAKIIATGRRPWQVVPKWRDMVECIYDADKAIAAITDAINCGGTVSWDYEATGLKPEPKAQRIYTVSLAWGKGPVPDRCVAMPWALPGVPDAIRTLLVSPVAKSAANMKFEYRWTLQKLGVHVRNLVWDTQLAAHWENPQAGTEAKSLKFLAYAELGHPIYNQGMDIYLETATANGLNTIHRCPMDKLLLYNGLDSLLEYIIAKKQQKRAGYQP